MHGSVQKMRGPPLGAWQFQPGVAPYGPAAHHGMGDVDMELQPIGIAILECLMGKGVAFGEQRGAARQFETFAMPLIDVIGPGTANSAASFRRPDRVIADLRM